jgi:hypothetical protein
MQVGTKPTPAVSSGVPIRRHTSNLQLNPRNKYRFSVPDGRRESQRPRTGGFVCSLTFGADPAQRTSFATASGGKMTSCFFPFFQ